jgi:c(7)-type cytochrome triheme protein
MKGGDWMKTLTLALVVIIALAFIGSAFAVPPGKELTFPDGAQGKVTFSGKVHADKGLKCMDCHPKIFPMKQGAVKITMSDIYAGKYCGTCHNGEKAFAAKGNCEKCHKK